MENKNKKKFMIGSLIILLVLVIAISYAAFRYSKLGEKENVITFGTLKLTLEEGTTVNLDSVYPLKDSEGLQLDGYSFTLENTGLTDANYKIYLDDEEITSPDVKLDDKYLKYSLNKNSTVGSVVLLESLGENGSRILDQGTLNVGGKNTYLLRVWPTIDVDGEFGGQVWKGKLRITGDQVRG